MCWVARRRGQVRWIREVADPVSDRRNDGVLANIHRSRVIAEVGRGLIVCHGGCSGRGHGPRNRPFGSVARHRASRARKPDWLLAGGVLRGQAAHPRCRRDQHPAAMRTPKVMDEFSGFHPDPKSRSPTRAIPATAGVVRLPAEARDPGRGRGEVRALRHPSSLCAEKAAAPSTTAITTAMHAVRCILASRRCPRRHHRPLPPRCQVAAAPKARAHTPTRVQGPGIWQRRLRPANPEP